MLSSLKQGRNDRAVIRSNFVKWYPTAKSGKLLGMICRQEGNESLTYSDEMSGNAEDGPAEKKSPIYLFLKTFHLLLCSLVLAAFVVSMV